MRVVEEIYSYKFDFKSVHGQVSNAAVFSGKINTTETKLNAGEAPTSLQEAAAKCFGLKYKVKAKKDQLAMDLLTSIDYHR